jgi:two-component system nitrate/nitrite response regulator NarL
MNETKPIRVIVVDGYALIREGIARVLEGDSDIFSVSTYGHISDALSALTATPVDIVVLDYEAAPNKTADSMAIARQNGFLGPFLVVAGNLQDSETFDLVRCGAAGIVSKSEPPDVLITAIRKLYQGGLWLKDEHIRVVISSIALNHKAASGNRLSVRERDVLNAVLEGQSSKQIASELGVSESAVKSTIQHLFRKTGTRNRGQLIKVALERIPINEL